MKSGLCAGVLVGVAFAIIPAARLHAQADLERFERQLEQVYRDTRLRIDDRVPVEQRSIVDYGGYLTLAFAAIDDTDQNTHILRQYELTLYGRVSIDGVHEFFVRGHTRYRDFNSGDDFDGHGDDWEEPTLDRGHYRFNLRRAQEAYDGTRGDVDLILQGGRQLVHWANGLVISQEIDGGTGTIGYGPLALDFVAGITRESTTDFDSSRPGFDGNTKRGFFGGTLAWQVVPEHRPFIYGLVQQDYNDDEVLVTDGDIETRFEYNSFYIGIGSTGNFGDNLLYTVEAVYEGGDSLSRSTGADLLTPVAQTEEDISAWAFDAILDYLVADSNRSRFTAEVLVASGDSDRQTTSDTFGGNESGTNDNAFNGFGLINTGLAFAPNVSNILMFRAGASTFPLPGTTWFDRLQIGSDLLLFHKLKSDAPIDEATSDNSYLGFEADFYANWQITSDLIFGVRYGVFFPGEAIETDHDPRHFFFSTVTIGF